jgi:hypothetical protein
MTSSHESSISPGASRRTSTETVTNAGGDAGGDDGATDGNLHQPDRADRAGERCHREVGHPELVVVDGNIASGGHVIDT